MRNENQRFSKGQRLGGWLILIANVLIMPAWTLGWWPLAIPGVLCLYFGFMLSCFT